jgi:formate/nitrite transporter FocA (FNT family)
MILLAIWIAIRTYQTTKHAFVILEIVLFVINNFCFALRLYMEDGTT